MSPAGRETFAFGCTLLCEQFIRPDVELGLDHVERRGTAVEIGLQERLFIERLAELCLHLLLTF